MPTNPPLLPDDRLECPCCDWKGTEQEASPHDYDAGPGWACPRCGLRLKAAELPASTEQLTDNTEKALAYYQATAAQSHPDQSRWQRPPWLPSIVRLVETIHGDGPFGLDTYAEPGEHACQANQWGAVSVPAANGNLLGLRPAEFEPIAWVENPHLADPPPPAVPWKRGAAPWN